MTVFVDPAKNKLGRMIMCHMIADSREELDRMVDLIGVNRRWIQCENSWKEHYDICLNKRTKAVDNGAIEISSKELIKILIDRRRSSVDTGEQKS